MQLSCRRWWWRRGSPMELVGGIFHARCGAFGMWDMSGHFTEWRFPFSLFSQLSVHPKFEFFISLWFLDFLLDFRIFRFQFVTVYILSIVFMGVSLSSMFWYNLNFKIRRDLLNMKTFEFFCQSVIWYPLWLQAATASDSNRKTSLLHAWHMYLHDHSYWSLPSCNTWVRMWKYYGCVW